MDFLLQLLQLIRVGDCVRVYARVRRTCRRVCVYVFVCACVCVCVCLSVARACVYRLLLTFIVHFFSSLSAFFLSFSQFVNVSIIWCIHVMLDIRLLSYCCQMNFSTREIKLYCTVLYCIGLDCIVCGRQPTDKSLPFFHPTLVKYLFIRASLENGDSSKSCMLFFLGTI